MLDTDALLTQNELLNDFNEGLKTIKTPSKSFLFDHCVYNFQINDHGFVGTNHSHRSIYDIYKLDCKKSVTIKNSTKDIYVRHFFINIEKFNIFDLQLPSSFWSIYHDKILRFLTITYIIITTIDSKIKTINKLFYYKKYRERISNKIKYHYSNKTLLNYTYSWLIG